MIPENQEARGAGSPVPCVSRLPAIPSQARAPACHWAQPTCPCLSLTTRTSCLPAGPDRLLPLLSPTCPAGPWFSLKGVCWGDQLLQTTCPVLQVPSGPPVLSVVAHSRGWGCLSCSPLCGHCPSMGPAQRRRSVSIPLQAPQPYFTREGVSPPHGHQCPHSTPPT